MKAAKLPQIARLLNLSEAEKITGLSRFSIRRLIDRGELPAIKGSASGLRRVLVDAADIAALIDRWKRESAADGAR